MTAKGRTFLCRLALLLATIWSAHSPRAEGSVDGIEFFERRIRPVLAQDCYECHRTGVSEKGGLALDHRAALLKGGRSGKVIIPGDPNSSPLIRAIRHESEDLKMPKSAPKLESAIIADFEQWVRMGAPDPRDRPPKDAEVAGDTSWTAVMERRESWWSFQPIRKQKLPEDASGNAGAHPIDRLIRARLAASGLTLAERADRPTMLRRLSFALRGLPPTSEEIQAFTNDATDGAFESLVDSFLASPRFGERWARHWMDWVRYADSHGSEGDPEIPYSWRYRDYLIRALNQDVPFDQMLREHLAGDLLSVPRINKEMEVNESALGIGHFRMLQHGFSPTDPLEERVRNIDDQIDVISKAFLGLTVSCARCHNHKFDAISQNDFYAFYGILAATTPASIGVQAPGENQRNLRRELSSLKAGIQSRISAAWARESPRIAAKLLEPDAKVKESVAKAKDATSVLNLFYRIQNLSGNVPAAVSEWRSQAVNTSEVAVAPVKRWDLSTKDDFTEWRSAGTAELTSAGSFVIAREGDRVLEGIYPGGVYSHLVSSKDAAFMVSPRINLDQGYDLWLRVAGEGGAIARYAVQNYPRDGTVYPVTRLNGGDWRWVKHGLDYWTRDTIHVELSTAADQPVVADKGALRSWFGIAEAVITRKGEPQPRSRSGSFNDPLLAVFRENEPQTVETIADGYARAARDAAVSWAEGRISDGQALLLDQMLRLGLLDNSISTFDGVEPLVAAYRRLEAELREPVRAPGLIETAAEDQPLLVRGNHKQPGDRVPRKFLDAFSSIPYRTEKSGRLELAEDFLSSRNPLTARVMVNRVWHHLFGQGIVTTPDNFGRLGDQPSHPELLDFLASWFVENDYSIKKLIRLLVTSASWQASSIAPPGAQDKDPGNRLFSHAGIRRLEAESIRDALLRVSGELNEEMYGAPVLGSVPRRSVYVRVKRNDLDPVLAVFDAPAPASTKGRRDVTNVPGQSLTLLNDPFVIALAERWAERIVLDAKLPGDAARIEHMFVTAFGRRPTPDEIENSQRFLRGMAAQQKSHATERNEVDMELRSRLEKLADLKKIARARVNQSRKQADSDSAKQVPPPIAAWDFREGMEDQLGKLHGKAFGNARIENGALLLDGKSSYIATPALPIALHAKTLAAWVQLDTLSQQGGGVMAVQDLHGEVFDAIVFGEQRAGHWVAGSDFFRRTSDFEGPREMSAHDEPVHLAIVYAEDGTVTAYRNGVVYGKPYKANGPVRFDAGQSQVLFGNRHGAPGGNRNLAGRVLGARLYARALTAQEIGAVTRSEDWIVSERELFAALTEAERSEYQSLESQREQLEHKLRLFNQRRGLSSEWADLAHALFNLKEFIYIR